MHCCSNQCVELLLMRRLMQYRNCGMPEFRNTGIPEFRKNFPFFFFFFFFFFFGNERRGMNGVKEIAIIAIIGLSLQTMTHFNLTSGIPKESPKNPQRILVFYYSIQVDPESDQHQHPIQNYCSIKYEYNSIRKIITECK